MITIEHTRLAYYADFAIYLMAVLILPGLLWQFTPTALRWALALAGLAGLVLWSLIEYAMHRFVFHGVEAISKPARRAPSKAPGADRHAHACQRDRDRGIGLAARDLALRVLDGQWRGPGRGHRILWVWCGSPRSASLAGKEWLDAPMQKSARHSSP